MIFNSSKSMKPFTRGVRTPGLKEATRDKAIRRLPFARVLTLPLLQHLGLPARPIVREGQEVVRGEPVAEPDGFFSVALHAPATGVIQSIGTTVNAYGETVPALVLKVYTAASQEILYGTPLEIDAFSPNEIAKAVQEAGIVGLGGEGFPTHAKLALPDKRRIDTVIANGCESEPYLTSDYRVLVERLEDVILGLRLALKATGAERGIVAIEDDKTEVVESLRKALAGDPQISVAAVEARYPLGAERVLIRSLLGREVPSGGLPVDVNVAAINTSTLQQIGELLPRRGGCIDRVVTVSGPGIERPGNYLVPLGTPIQFILKQAGLRDSATEVLLGGPMAGIVAARTDAPLTKGITGIVALTADAPLRANGKSFPCIKCGECIDVCPVNLNPSQLHLLAQDGKTDIMLEDWFLQDCIECGCCNYVCPSNLPLVQEFRAAKNAERRSKTAS
jgi:electron transport complex protein RnfC